MKNTCVLKGGEARVPPLGPLLPETIISFRHGLFEGNERAHATGKAAEAVVADGLGLHDYDEMDLLEDGEDQAELLQQVLAGFTIHACLCSPPKRAKTTAKIVLRGRDLITGIETHPDLHERNRGIFAYMPDEWTRQHPAYHIGKESTLNWRPVRGGPPGKQFETLQEVIDRRLPRVIQRGNAIAAGKTIAFSTHGEFMGAMRGAPELAALTDEQFLQPLVPNPPDDIPALQKAKWIGNAQADVYTRRNPDTGEVSELVTHFRTMGVVPRFFDSGWIEIPR